MLLYKEYSIADAKNNLSSLVREAEKGKSVRLTRRGKPVARLVAEKEFARLGLEHEPNLWDTIKAFRNAADFSGVALTDADIDSWRDRGTGREFHWR